MVSRINKYLSENGICSRRAAEKMILSGDVLVNNIPAILGQKIDDTKDEVKVNGEIITKNKALKTYIMINKPRGFVTTMSDELQRKCVADLLPLDLGRIVPVGRLDKLSEGLLLMSNDGDFVYKLTHPSKEIPKVYLVTVKGHPTREKIMELNSELTIDDYQIKKCDVMLLSKKEDRCVLKFVLYEGRNRQIRKMCEAVDLQILRLKRISLGELRLGELKSGQWRYLDEEEVKHLMEW